MLVVVVVVYFSSLMVCDVTVLCVFFPAKDWTRNGTDDGNTMCSFLTHAKTTSAKSGSECACVRAFPVPMAASAPLRQSSTLPQFPTHPIPPIKCMREKTSPSMRNETKEDHQSLKTTNDVLHLFCIKKIPPPSPIPRINRLIVFSSRILTTAYSTIPRNIILIPLPPSLPPHIIFHHVLRTFESTSSSLSFRPMNRTKKMQSQALQLGKKKKQ